MSVPLVEPVDWNAEAVDNAMLRWQFPIAGIGLIGNSQVDSLHHENVASILPSPVGAMR